MKNNNSNNAKAVSITMIFEASALNRDEKIGGNIPSIKKLTRANKGIFSYLSRVAMRHYLFCTLNKLYPEDWDLAPTFESGSGDNKVVQFKLQEANILTHAELDAFGYMFTIGGGQLSITRKSPVGITKAISFEPWEGDMQFNANHDLAKRCGANPNPVNKEEHVSYFKVSFTIDIEKLGYDEWWIKDYNYDNTNLTLFLSEKGTDVVLKGVKKEDDGKFKIKDCQINIDGLSCTVSKELMEEKEEKSKNQERKKYISFKKDFLEKTKKEDDKEEQSDKSKKDKATKFKIYEGDYKFDEEENTYQFTIGNYDYNEEKETLTLSLVLAHSISAEKTDKDNEYIIKGKGTITIKDEGSKKKAIFQLNDEIKRKRLDQILTVLKDGLIYHASGECDGITPVFIIAGALKLPIPIFHSFIELNYFENSILNNSYILKDENGKKLIYVYNPKNLVKNIDTNEFLTDWEKFKEALGIKDEKNETNTTSEKSS